jgi:hypothetical protein
MIIPLLILAGIAIVLFQFRDLFKLAYLRTRASQWIKHDPHEAKIMDDLDVKRLCIKCGSEMERGEALIQFFNRDHRVTAFDLPNKFGSIPDSLPLVSTNPFHQQIIGRNTYYCRKCQLFELNPKSLET